MLKLIDTHAHLDFKNFKNDFEQVVSNAYEHGVVKIINAASTPASNHDILKMIKTHSFIYGALGIHPHDAKHANIKDYDLIRLEGANVDKIVAIGEIGLDYHYEHSPKNVQQKVFRELISIAKDLCLPIIIHDRKAHEDTMRILKDEKAGDNQGVFHCFSGDVEFAKEVLDFGFLISITGVVTFKNAHVLHDVVKYVPLEKMMIETDCPFLTPVPYRGKRNEPSYVRYIAETIAKIKNIDVKEVAEQTTENAIKLFKLPNE